MYTKEYQTIQDSQPDTELLNTRLLESPAGFSPYVDDRLTTSDFPNVESGTYCLSFEASVKSLDSEIEIVSF